MKEIRDVLGVCGRCKNAKLIVWETDADLDGVKTISRDRKTDSHYMLRCNWLKQAILEPQHIKKCEGRQDVTEV